VIYAQLIVLLISMYGVRLGAYALLYPHIGADALWYSFVLSSVLSMALTLAVYFLAPWRKLMLDRVER
jgi:Na+-driven multidrug efflux pump